jgi:D-alanyl-D-alanine carboxypeptidase
MGNILLNKEIKYSIAILCIPLLVVFSIYFFSKINNSTEDVQENQSATVSKSLPIIEYVNNPFEDIRIQAQSAIVKDLNTGEVLYSKDANTSRPLASITKIMTALVTYYSVEDLEKPVYITPTALQTEGESFLSLGERFKMQELVDFMLISSSNDGAAAISQAVQLNNPGTNFVTEMNLLANKIGLEKTYFLNETGLDQDLINAGAFGSANDVALLFEYTLRNYPEIFEKTNDSKYSDYSESGILHEIDNTNKVLPNLKNIIASKTGYTDIAGGNLAVIVDPGLNRPIVIVVLGSTAEGRFNDVLKLSNSLEQYFDYEFLTN